MTVASIVLAGGKSSRLGKDKHSEIIAGKTLIKRVIDRLRPLSAETLIVISQSQTTASFSFPDVRIFSDIFPATGPLGGIYTGLMHSRHSHNLVVACDMPFLNATLLHYMIDLSPEFDIVIPRIGDKIEPLHAVYSRNCLDPMRKLLEKGDLKIDHVFDAVKVLFIEEEELNKFDPPHLSFFNINTHDDLVQARSLAEKEAIGLTLH